MWEEAKEYADSNRFAQFAGWSDRRRRTGSSACHVQGQLGNEKSARDGRKLMYLGGSLNDI